MHGVSVLAVVAGRVTVVAVPAGQRQDRGRLTHTHTARGGVQQHLQVVAEALWNQWSCSSGMCFSSMCEML